MKFTTRKHKSIMRSALIYMIGQSHQMNIQPDTAHVAAWLGVTKPTALRFLKQMKADGILHQEIVPYRTFKNGTCCNKHYWSLSILGRVMLQSQETRGNYDMVARSRIEGLL